MNDDTGILSGCRSYVKIICMTTDAKKNLENDLDLLDVDKVKELNNIFNV